MQGLSEWIFLSTPSARRATAALDVAHQPNDISIHALREEGDAETAYASMTLDAISIHALREEGDDAVSRSSMRVYHFYPRPPRGGRHHDIDRIAASGEISIHALREEGDCFHRLTVVFFNHISIHALREEGDLLWRSPPLQRHISIHALREEGDRQEVSFVIDL